MNPAASRSVRPARGAMRTPRPSGELTPSVPVPAAAGESAWALDIRAALARARHTVRHPARWTRRGWVFAVLILLYVVLTMMVLIPNSPALKLDQTLADLHFGSKHASWLPWVKFVVGFGQRWIMTQGLEVVIVVAALRARSIKPLVQFGLAIILLNTSVAAVKYSIGRIGPAHNTDVHKIFELGGTIYPSGHVSNTVVLYGMLVLAIPRLRAWLAAFAVAISIVVGLGTIYLRTHWSSDVMGGWIAGLLVLMALPVLTPWAERFAASLIAWARPVLEARPRLHRVARAVLRFGMRVIPEDPNYYPSRVGSAAGSGAPATVRVPEPEEFAEWPAAGARTEQDAVPGRETVRG